jgi:hypothetical protein
MSNAARTVVRDLGFGKVVDTIRKVATGYITVGVHGDQITRDGTSLALVASANEFGTKDGRIPSRSFIRRTFDTKRSEIRQIQHAALLQVTLGRISPEQGLGLIGAFIQGEIRATIRSNVPPINAASWARTKGMPREQTLRHTGQLAQGVTYRVHTGPRPGR